MVRLLPATSTELIELADRYVEFASSHSGFAQSRLGSALGIDQRVVQRVGWVCMSPVECKDDGGDQQTQDFLVR